MLPLILCVLFCCSGIIITFRSPETDGKSGKYKRPGDSRDKSFEKTDYPTTESLRNQSPPASQTGITQKDSSENQGLFSYHFMNFLAQIIHHYQFIKPVKCVIYIFSGTTYM